MSGWEEERFEAGRVEEPEEESPAMEAIREFQQMILRKRAEITESYIDHPRAD